jgi:tetratricopeptide (TPR) repeat protein
LQKPSSERVQVFESYPDLTKMPAPLVFELALNLAESGDFDRAASLFHNRFFPREEGGTNVRQVWVEVQLLRALNDAQNEHCEQALATANSLADPMNDLSFTNDGMEPFVDSARTNYLLAKMYGQCGAGEKSRTHLERAARKTDAGGIVWAWRAAKELPAFDNAQWTPRLESALQHTEAMSQTSALAGWWVYNTGMLQRALGREVQAQQDFRQALLLPDRWLSYHLTREALLNAGQH